MRTTKGAVITLLLAVMLLATRQLVQGQSEVPTPDNPVVVDEMARGTKVPGTLTIYYEPTTICPIRVGGAAKLFFIRLQHGKDLIALSGDLSGQNICLGQKSEQKDAIKEFIEANLQKIFPDTPSACCVALRSVDMDQFVLGVDDRATPMIEPLFVMIDFVITIQTK